MTSLAACGGGHSDPPPVPERETNDTPAPPPPGDRPTLRAPTDDPPAPPPETASEVVYVLMRDRFLQKWFCTGTLVSRRTVVTAAHCLDTKMFVTFEIVAPLAPKRPRTSASKPRAFGGDYEVVENPDIGILTLDEPIDLPAYGELTNVVARVEAGEDVRAAAVVRTEELPEAPLHLADTVPVSSTVQYGYEHGFGTPMFTHGGDSGAGLFLVEGGKRTRKLIGVARQPEPSRDLDHFTRIDPGFLDWFAANATQDR